MKLSSLVWRKILQHACLAPLGTCAAIFSSTHVRIISLSHKQSHDNTIIPITFLSWWNNPLHICSIGNGLVLQLSFFWAKMGIWRKKYAESKKIDSNPWRLPSGLFSISLKCTFFVGGAGAGMMDRQSATKQLPSTSCERFRGTDRKYWPKIFCWVHHYHHIVM